MRSLVALTAVAVAAATLTATAVAAPVRHFDWHHLSLAQRIHAQRSLIVADWKVVTTWRTRQVRLKGLAPSSGWRKVSALLVEPSSIHWRYLHMKWTQRELRESLRQLARSRSSPSASAGFPPHHALWVCIGGHEGSPTSVNPNGHYGMLQMHWNWGYGIVGAASNYSQAAQEWAAERAYEASGRSRSFLIGQWLEWDGAYECLAYA